MTSWVYRLLGLLAPINQRTSQFRANYIPSNVLLLIALGVILFLNTNRILAVMKARTPPTPQPVRELLLKVRFAGAYVAPEGRLATDARIDFDQQSAGGNLTLMDYIWVPLVDRRPGEALLVQFDAKHSFNKEGEDAPSVVIAISLALLLSMVWLTLNRNVVFMPSDRAPVPGGTAQTAAPEPLFVSGTLAFDGKTRRFFTNMPGTITRADSGNLVFVSVIETSRTVWGLKHVEHSGLWSLSIQAGSITDVQAGDVFWGMQKRRAIRFRFVNSATGKQDRAVIASATADPVAALYA